MTNYRIEEARDIIELHKSINLLVCQINSLIIY